MRNDKKFNRSDIEIHYEILGQGSPLLCISGFGCSSYNFEFIKDELSKDHTLILVDNRGMGKSPSVIHDYLIDDLALDGIELMSFLGFSKYSVMGISMGGFVAQKVALYDKSKVLALVLACTTSGGRDFPALNKLDEESIRRSFSLDTRTYNLLVSQATVHPNIIKNRPDIFQDILDLRIKNMPKLDQVLLQQRAVDKFLEENVDLEEITCPTLVITGDEDRFVSPESANVLGKKIPNSTVKFIKESDHHFFLEKPIETAKEVSQYLGLQL